MIRSLLLLLGTQPAVPVVWVLWVLGLTMLVVRQRAVGLWVAGLPVATLLAGTVVTPAGGPVPGLARVCDVDPTPLLWPWRWTEPDPRLLPVLMLAVTGAALARRPRWLAGVALLLLAAEAVAWLVPGTAAGCSVVDLGRGWQGLAVGWALGSWLRPTGRGSAGRREAPGRWVPGVAALVLALLLVLPVVAGEVTARRSDPQPASALGPADGPGTAAWVAQGRVPGAGGPWDPLARSALRDLRRLTVGAPGRLPVAGPEGAWSYAWPRDTAFLAVALARTGHDEDARAVLAGVARLHLDPRAGFDARYAVDGSRVGHRPRQPQPDGCGWVLWALHAVAPGPSGDAALEDLRTRCTDQVLRATAGGRRLPLPAPDYWEQGTYASLLGASAPLVVGLDAAAEDAQAAGEKDRSDLLNEAQARLDETITAAFGPASQRAGDTGGLDVALAWTLPPWHDGPPGAGTLASWGRYLAGAGRPGGGLSPGTGWPQDGLSWTPPVALAAWHAAATGERAEAERWLAWLAAHRDARGSLPEKVGADGQPLEPAPLGWTAALVLLTLVDLEG